VSGNVSPTWVNKVHLISPQNNGLPERIYANTLGNYIFTDAAGAPNGILTHNGPRTYFADCNILASNNNVGYFKGYYSTTNISGATTGRLTVKG
jgi:hypothetical protein